MKNKKMLSIMIIMLILLTGCNSKSLSSSNMKNGNTNYISEAEAKNIALENLGVGLEEIQEYEINLKEKNEEALYKIELETSENKYEYTVNATSGNIIEYSMNSQKETKDAKENKEIKNETTDNKADKTEEKVNELDADGISEIEAINIVLNAISMSKSDLVFLKSYVVKYNGSFAYHVKFKTNDNYTEYDYIVDIATGNILKITSE